MDLGKRIGGGTHENKPLCDVTWTQIYLKLLAFHSNLLLSFVTLKHLLSRREKYSAACVGSTIIQQKSATKQEETFFFL